MAPDVQLPLHPATEDQSVRIWCGSHVLCHCPKSCYCEDHRASILTSPQAPELFTWSGFWLPVRSGWLPVQSGLVQLPASGPLRRLLVRLPASGLRLPASGFQNAPTPISKLASNALPHLFPNLLPKRFQTYFHCVCYQFHSL